MSNEEETPKTRLKAVTIKMSPEQKHLLKVFASIHDMDLSTAMLWAVEEQAKAMGLDSVLAKGRGRTALSIAAA